LRAYVADRNLFGAFLLCFGFVQHQHHHLTNAKDKGTDSTVLRTHGKSCRSAINIIAEIFSKERKNQEKWTICSRGFSASATSFMGIDLWLEVSSKVPMAVRMTHEAKVRPSLMRDLQRMLAYSHKPHHQ
jgi:hypothetical protein